MDITNLLFSFNGRINRTKYWLTYLILGIVPIFVILLFAAISSELAIVLYIVYAVIVIWPSLAITAKRWHDRDKSAWWILIGFIPIIGALWSLIELGFLKGTDGENRFGPEPLEKV